MEIYIIVVLAVVGWTLYQRLKEAITAVQQRLDKREAEYTHLSITVARLQQEVLQLREAARSAPIVSPPPRPNVSAVPAAAPVGPVGPELAPVAKLPTPPVSPPPTPLSPRVSIPAAPVPVALVPAVPTPIAQPAAPVLPSPVPQPSPAPSPPPASEPTKIPPPPTSRPQPVPSEPVEPTWWERTEQLFLDNWTGILGAVVLVTGVGFLGIYTALRVTPPVRFAMISGFAAALLGGHYYLRRYAFAAKLNVWLQSSAAAIFLFACVGAVSVPGLQWAGPPLNYLLLLLGVAANLWLAWSASRETVATLHGVLSLVALAVISPTLVTLAAAAGVTAFSIAITYRHQWKYQLLLSIVSFFAFHQFWYFHLAEPPTGATRLVAMALMVLVGGAAAVVQYRRVYARTAFDGLLFSAHILNWTCLGVNLFHYSTGSPWKTVPLALGALLTFGVARQARRLGIQWLFQTDTVISLLLGLATAFSLLGWHATGPFVLLFMLLETLLVAFIMAREGERLVFQIASTGAVVAGAALLVVTGANLLDYTPAELHRNALLLWLAGAGGAGYFHWVSRQPLLSSPQAAGGLELYRAFGGLVGALYLGSAALLMQALFGATYPPVAGLVGAAAAASGGVYALAWWVRGGATWFRTLHLLVGQVLLAVAVLGLHKAGLVWPATATVLYLESLLLAWLLARQDERPAFQLLVAGALLTGVWLVFAGLGELSVPLAGTLVRNASLLIGTGTLTAVFFQRLNQFPFVANAPTGTVPRVLQASAGGLGGIFYVVGAGTLLQAMFGLSNPPVAGLVGGAALASGLVFGLAWWLRAGAPWFRLLHLLAGQLLLACAVLGLHKTSLSWPVTLTLLYAEMLAMSGLFAWRAEPLAYRVLLYATLLLAFWLPAAGYYASPGELSDERRALLLVLAALASGALQAFLHHRKAPVYDALPFSAQPLYQPRLVSLVAGLLLLAAAGLVYEHTWASWVTAGLGAVLLAGRRAVPVPGLWLALLLVSVGYHALQWSQAPVLSAPGSVLATLGYFLPLLAVSATGLAYSWRAARQQQVRWPWLYLGGAHLAVVAWVVAAPPAGAAPLLLWLGLAAGAAFAAQQIRRRFPVAADLYWAGNPDRFLLHLTYALVGWALLWHFGNVLPGAEQLLGFPARRWTVAGLLVTLAALAWARPPATAPHYRSWRYVQPLLPEAALLLAAFTGWWEVRAPWQPLLWVVLALALLLGARRLPERLRRLSAYSLLFFWSAAVSSIYASLMYLAPGQLLTANWVAAASAAALLFGFAALALLQATGAAPAVTWPALVAGLAPLAQLQQRPQELVGLLLYPAFAALTVLLVQSFDRSILTVLLMLEVVGVFVSSLLLRRQDLRYAALAGILVCLVRLVFFDLRQSSTIARAVVFILMGLLLLGMNALYARFRERFSPQPGESSEAEAPDAG
ncbi:MAG TPA: hypothetical protein VF690_15335 [Hymenobacter sp.]